MKFHHPSHPEEAGGGLDIELLMTESRWQPLMEVLPEAIVLMDPAGQVRFLNSAAESVTEVLRSEVVGRPLQELVSRSRLDLGFLPAAFADGVRVARSVATDPDGRMYLLNTRGVRDWNGNLTCFLLTARSSEEAPSPPAGAAFDPDGRQPDENGPFGEEGMVLSEPLRLLLERGLRAIRLGSRMLLLGESGVGKTEFARLLHRMSFGSARPFVHVNCGSIPESLFESEMFGYERGSFTGALSKGKRGLVEAADGGTLFLDEVGEIPLPSQAKMLQFLEEGGVQRVGATQLRRLRVQVVTATNRDLGRMIAEGRFRSDLFYRLKVVTLRLPALRECSDVLDPLIDRFLARVNRRRGAPLRLDRACRQLLREHSYPGNVRELQNLIEHLSVMCETGARARDLTEALQHVADPALVHATEEPSGDGATPLAAEPLSVAVRRYEARLVREAIARAGSKRKAAELLGVDIATVVRKSR